MVYRSWSGWKKEVFFLHRNTHTDFVSYNITMECDDEKFVCMNPLNKGVLMQKLSLIFFSLFLKNFDKSIKLWIPFFMMIFFFFCSMQVVYFNENNLKFIIEYGWNYFYNNIERKCTKINRSFKQIKFISIFHTFIV